MIFVNYCRYIYLLNLKYQQKTKRMQSIASLNRQKCVSRSSQQSNSSIYSRMLRSNKAISQEDDTAKQFADLQNSDKLIAGYQPQNILDLQIDPIQGKRYLVKYKDASYKLCTWQNATTLHRFGELLSQFNTKLSQGLIKLGEGKKKYKKAISRLKRRDEKKSKVIEDQDSKRIEGDVEQIKAKNIAIRKKRGKYKSKGSQQPKVTKKSRAAKANDNQRQLSKKKTNVAVNNLLKEKNQSQPQCDEENKKLKLNIQALKLKKNKDSQQSQQTTTFNPRHNKKKFNSQQGNISSQSYDSQLFQSQVSQTQINNPIQSQEQLPVITGDEPQRVARIWQESDGRVFVRVQWKQKEECKILPTNYGIESYPPAGYKLLMNFLVSKYQKAMKWDL